MLNTQPGLQISRIDDAALERMPVERVEMGAYINRPWIILSQPLNIAELYRLLRSRIEDADFAAESALAKAQVFSKQGPRC